MEAKSVRMELSIPVSYHCRFKDATVNETMTLNNTETVLLLRHTSNMGYPGVLEWRKDSPYAGILSMFAHAPRMREIIDQRIVPLVALARAVGVRIMYVVEGWDSARKYPQWQEIAKRAPEKEPWIWPESPNKEWIEEYEAEAFMPGYAEALRKLRKVVDIAPPLAPRPEDWIVTTTNQAWVLMSDNNILNLLVAGFDIHDDMMYSDEVGFYKYVQRFNSIVLEDCTAGVERHDTVENEEMKRLTLAFVSMMPIYLAQSSDVMTAIRDERGLRDV